MYTHLFSEFLTSDDTLRVYMDETQVFASKKERLLPLMEYIANHVTDNPPVTIFDKIMGNAAALLSIKINCRNVYSPLGSEFAAETLRRYGINYHISSIVSYIQREDGQGMCPMEQMSLHKEPEDFYRELRALINMAKSDGKEVS